MRDNWNEDFEKPIYDTIEVGRDNLSDWILMLEAAIDRAPNFVNIQQINLVIKRMEKELDG